MDGVVIASAVRFQKLSDDQKESEEERIKK